METDKKIQIVKDKIQFEKNLENREKLRKRLRILLLNKQIENLKDQIDQLR